MKSKYLYIPISNLQVSSELTLENAKILRSDNAPDGIRDLISTICKFFIEIHNINNEIPRRVLDQVLTVFKLFKDDLVFSQDVFSEGTHDHLPHYVHWTEESRKYRKYTLDASEVENFQMHWKKYVNIPHDIFCIQRFNLADFLAYSRDRYCSYVEAMEYLLVPDSSEGEISFKFRFRGTYLLGRNKSESQREEIYDLLKQAYSLRSSIIHGNMKNVDKASKKNKDWESITNPIRNSCRQLIKIFVDEDCLDNKEKRTTFLLKNTILKTQL